MFAALQTCARNSRVQINVNRHESKEPLKLWDYVCRVLLHWCAIFVNIPSQTPLGTAPATLCLLGGEDYDVDERAGAPASRQGDEAPAQGGLVPRAQIALKAQRHPGFRRDDAVGMHEIEKPRRSVRPPVSV